VHALDLDVEDGVRVERTPVSSSDEVGQALLVGALDGHDSLRKDRVVGEGLELLELRRGR
jgi:hypothetical protein